MDGTAQLLESDRRFLVHPLHHPEDHKPAKPLARRQMRRDQHPFGIGRIACVPQSLALIL